MERLPVDGVAEASEPKLISAEIGSLCEVEELATKYVIRMHVKESLLRELELELTHEELTVCGQIALAPDASPTSRFEERFLLPEVFDGNAIEVLHPGTALLIVVPKSRKARASGSPSVYYRPALRLQEANHPECPALAPRISECASLSAK